MIQVYQTNHFNISPKILLFLKNFSFTSFLFPSSFASCSLSFYFLPPLLLFPLTISYTSFFPFPPYSIVLFSPSCFCHLFSFLPSLPPFLFPSLFASFSLSFPLWLLFSFLPSLTPFLFPSLFDSFSLPLCLL